MNTSLSICGCLTLTLDQKNESLDDEILRRAASFQRKLELRERDGNESIQIGKVVDDTQDDNRRYKIGIDCIDHRLGPLRPAGFTVIGALSGYGKTSFVEQVGAANAVDYQVFFATLEMTEAEIQTNMTARIMGATLEEFERERRIQSDSYLAAMDKISALNLRLWRPPVGKLATVKMIFKQAQRTHSDVILIDYNKLLEGWVPGTAAATIVNEIQATAQTTGIHTMLLAQLKFESVGKRPTLNDMEDTKRLNHAATSVLLIHRPYAGKDTRDVIAEIIGAKNRKGKMFRGHAHWYGPTHTFYSMTPEEESRAPCCKPRPPRNKKTPTLASPRDPNEMTREEEDALMDSLPL
jgi:replicative DNA helicase